MANEGLATGLLQATRNGASVNRSDSDQFDVNSNLMVQQTQLISAASGTTIDLGGITLPPAYLRIKNLDTVNRVRLAVDIGMADADKFADLKPGKFALWPPFANTIFAQATTTASWVEIVGTDSD